MGEIKRGRKSNLNKEELIEAYKQIKNREELAVMFDVNLATIENNLIKLGLYERKKKKVYHFDNELITQMIIDGKSKTEIAEHFGVSLNSMKSYIQKRKLDPNYKPRKKKDVDLDKVTSDESDLTGLKRAEPPKKPFKDVVQGQRVVDVSCLYGI